MKLNFSKKEYAALLEMLYMADWVLHAHSEEKGESTEEYRLLMQKALEAAKNFNLEEAVARDDRADAVLRQYLIHVVFGRRHVAVFPCEETVHGRADDPVLQGKVLQLQRRFDDAHDKSPMNPR